MTSPDEQVRVFRFGMMRQPLLPLAGCLSIGFGLVIGIGMAQLVRPAGERSPDWSVLIVLILVCVLVLSVGLVVLGGLCVAAALRCRVRVGSSQLEIRNVFHTYRFEYPGDSLTVHLPDHDLKYKPGVPSMDMIRPALWVEVGGDMIRAQGTRIDHRGSGRRDRKQLMSLGSHLRHSFPEWPVELFPST